MRGSGAALLGWKGEAIPRFKWTFVRGAGKVDDTDKSSLHRLLKQIKATRQANLNQATLKRSTQASQDALGGQTYPKEKQEISA